MADIARRPMAAPVLYGQDTLAQRPPLGAPVTYAGDTSRAPLRMTNAMAGDASRPGSLSYGMGGGGGLMAIPAPAPPLPNQPLGYTPPSPQTFGGQAPTPTPYGTFTAPNPADIQTDPYYQFRLSEGMKQQQRGAASRGTLLTGGFQKALLGYGQGLASEEANNAYSRALQTYGTNRETNAQNFGQGMQQYQGNLAGFNANTSAALGYGDLALRGAQANYGANRQGAIDTRDYQQSLNDYGAAQQNLSQSNADEEYARQVAAAKAQNDWYTANRGTAPQPKRLGTIRYPGR